MAPPFAFELDEADFATCKQALETIPREDWPSDDIWSQVYLSVRLRMMELAEAEVDPQETPP